MVAIGALGLSVVGHFELGCSRPAIERNADGYRNTWSNHGTRRPVVTMPM